MNATIVNSRVRLIPAQTPSMGLGPVEIPEMRINEDIVDGVSLVIARAGTPTMTIPCASRAVAERTHRFFGGTLS